MDLNKPVAHEEDRIFPWRFPKKTHKMAPLGKYSVLFFQEEKKEEPFSRSFLHSTSNEEFL
ncbi:hypothetical protein FZD05_04590 [Rossellomorea aquimaris]|jgi:hypothetical protein|nr:hypothetical protein [Rossellomorea sp. YC4-1]TYS82071.1 hypothetical protein FZD05_04590 [Rossellomorea aquimaris]